MSVEEEFEILYSYFSDEAVESMFNNLPQDTLDEVLQVVQLIERKLATYRRRIKDLEGASHNS